MLLAPDDIAWQAFLQGTLTCTVAHSLWICLPRIHWCRQLLGLTLSLVALLRFFLQALA